MWKAVQGSKGMEACWCGGWGGAARCRCGEAWQCEGAVALGQSAHLEAGPSAVKEKKVRVGMAASWGGGAWHVPR